MDIIKLYDNFAINILAEMLLSKYKKKDFKGLIELYTENINTNPFIDNDTKNKIMQTYNINLKLKYIVNKCIYNWRFKKTNSINQKTLCLEDINNIDNTDKIILFSNNTKYTFLYKELVKIFLNSIEKQDDIFPTPEIPCNPYTNEAFNINELVYIYNKLKEIYKRIDKEIPFTIKIFRESNFKINTLVSRFRDYITYTSCKNYVKDLDTKKWKELLQDFLIDYCLEEKICTKCLYKIDGYKQSFNNILINYHLHMNFQKFGLNPKKKFINLCKTYNLYKKKEQCKHRKIVKVKRKNIFNFTAPNSNESIDFNFTEDNIDMSTFRFTANSIEILESTD